MGSHPVGDPLCARGKAGWALNWPRVTAGRHLWVLLKPHSPGLLWARHVGLCPHALWVCPCVEWTCLLQSGVVWFESLLRSKGDEN